MVMKHVGYRPRQEKMIDLIALTVNNNKHWKCQTYWAFLPRPLLTASIVVNNCINNFQLK